MEQRQGAEMTPDHAFKAARDDELREQERARRRRRTNEKKLEEILLLEFTRQVVELTIKKHSATFHAVIPQREVTPHLTSGSMLNVRYDNGRHLIKKTAIKGVCQECKKRSNFRCDRCQVALHPECFFNYHVSEEEKE
jgi:hypothetical protein